MSQTQTTLRLARPRSPALPMPANAMDAAGSTPNGIASIASSALFGGASEICIHHLGSDYRLRITRLDKLILTK